MRVPEGKERVKGKNKSEEITVKTYQIVQIH